MTGVGVDRKLNDGAVNANLGLAILETSGARIYWVLLGAVSTFLIARFLGPSGRGIYAAALAWNYLAYVLLHFSFAPVVVYLASGKPVVEWLPKVAGTILTLTGGVTLVTWLIVSMFFVANWPQDLLKLGAPVVASAFSMLPFLLWAENARSILIAAGLIRTANLAQILSVTFGFLSVVLLVAVLRLGVIAAICAMVLEQIAFFMLTFRVIHRKADHFRFDSATARLLIRSGGQLHLNSIGGFAFTYGPVLFLNHFRTAFETGIYHLAYQLMSGMQVIPGAISSVAYAEAAERGPAAAWKQHRRMLVWSVGLMAVLAALAGFIAPWVIRLAAGPAFMPAVSVFRILLISTVSMAFCTVLTSQWIVRGRFLSFATLTLVAGAVSILLNVLFTPTGGSSAAAWATVSAHAVLFAGNLVMAWFFEQENRSRVSHSAGAADPTRS
jgi:O-antigen/teichoic acid export membrane protein